jgi:large subunit ribosomal protein L19
MKAQGLTRETILKHGVEDRQFPAFRVGDTIEVAQKVKEGDKERIQKFEGVVIYFRNNGIASTFTVRRIGANNIGVEKIFPYYSPMIDGIKLIKSGRVRRAQLFYLRDRVGKAAKVKEDLSAKLQERNAAAPTQS